MHGSPLDGVAPTLELRVVLRMVLLERKCTLEDRMRPRELVRPREGLVWEGLMGEGSWGRALGVSTFFHVGLINKLCRNTRVHVMAIWK